MGCADENVLSWCRGYVKAIIDELRPAGDVLEVGYGRGIAAAHIQNCKPKSHIIIEPDRDLAEKARKWAKSHPGVTVVEEPWQKALAKLKTFDAIFFNENSFENEIGAMLWLNREAATLASRSAQEVVSEIEGELALAKIHYSDNEIDEFCDKMLKTHKDEFARFFSGMKRRGNITDKQYEHILQKYKIKKEDAKIASFDFKKHAASLFLFIQECLKSHVNKGGRISCFLIDATSKYEDPQFFQNFITNPAINFTEKLVPIKMKDASKVEPGLVVVVEKL